MRAYLNFLVLKMNSYSTSRRSGGFKKKKRGILVTASVLRKRTRGTCVWFINIKDSQTRLGPTTATDIRSISVRIIITYSIYNWRRFALLSLAKSFMSLYSFATSLRSRRNETKFDSGFWKTAVTIIIIWLGAQALCCACTLVVCFRFCVSFRKHNQCLVSHNIFLTYMRLCSLCTRICIPLKISIR